MQSDEQPAPRSKLSKGILLAGETRRAPIRTLPLPPKQSSAGGVPSLLTSLTGHLDHPALHLAERPLLAPRVVIRPPRMPKAAPNSASREPSPAPP